jgi:AcrR family transcriptional regulator
MAALSKGEQTRCRIVDGALALARTMGLEQITIGTLAERLKLSKSGIFAHFGSKEEMQLAVLEETEARFMETVFRPALAAPRGITRVEKLFDGWLHFGCCDCDVCHSCPCQCEPKRQGGCLLISSSAEFDDKPGPIRDFLRDQILRLREAMVRTLDGCKQTGELRDDVDTGLLAMQIHALVLAVHLDVRLLGHKNAFANAHRALNALLRAGAPQTP